MLVQTNNNIDASQDPTSSSKNSWIEMATINCQDINDPQSFEIDPSLIASGGQLINLKKLKIMFTESTDFYGRITLYNVDLALL